MHKDLSIEKLSHDGRGIARLDGKTLFVAAALPGERVNAKLLKSHKRFDEYQAVAIVQASAQRNQPDCEHYDRCGGCQLQHLSPQGQICLLYTSDAADDSLRVDLGGRRIIKK